MKMLATSVTDEKIDGMLRNAIERFPDNDYSDLAFRAAMAAKNPCGCSPLDQMWESETIEFQEVTDREQYNNDQTDRLVERLHLLLPSSV